MPQVKIKKGMSLVTDFLEQPVYVRFPYIQLDLQSLRSHLGFYLVQMMKKELQDTASSYRPDEVWEYLMDNYDLSELQYLKSHTRKEYTLTDHLVVAYAMLQTKNAQLKQDLNLISTVLKYKNNIKDIDTLLSSIKSITRPRKLTPSGYVKNGHITYRPKYDVTKANIINSGGNSNVSSESLYSIYYDYLTVLSTSEVTNWTFIEGLTRKIESFYLPRILDGTIRATSKEGLRIQDLLLAEASAKGKDLIFIETLTERLAYCDEAYNRLEQEGYELRGLNDFDLYYSPKPVADKRRQKHEVEIITGLYVYDYDKQIELPVINRLIGLTGEFSRVMRTPQLYPTLIYDNDGEVIEMWPVEDTYDIAHDDIAVVNKVSRQMSQKVQTLYHADTQTSNTQLIKRIENKRLTYQMGLYINYTNEYNNIYN